jgi:hypothetical protein
MRVSVLKDHSNAAAFLSSTKVRIYRCDRRNSDRHGGTVLGFNAHLAIQFGIDLAKPPRMIAALACQAGGSAEATALPALIGRRNAAGQLRVPNYDKQSSVSSRCPHASWRTAKNLRPQFCKGLC